MTDDRELAALISKRFIQRKDVKAVQHGTDGAYRPDRTGWSMRNLLDHLEGKATFGHYLCDQESLVKLFVFDIDLEKSGTWVERPDLSLIPDDATADDVLRASEVVHESTPRSDWRDRRHPGRAWYKLQLRTMVELLSSAIYTQLEIKCASAYSGNKGAHVYGFFDEPIPAAEARVAALVALEYAGGILSPNHSFAPTRGGNFYKYSDPDPVTGFENLCIELFPKQDTMEGKDLGNLTRLPLGVNLKGPTRVKNASTVHEPTFFIDQRLAHDTLSPHPDPVSLLTSGNPWE